MKGGVILERGWMAPPQQNDGFYCRPIIPRIVLTRDDLKKRVSDCQYLVKL